jgi:alpha-1,2-mannosyltransferase
VNAAARISLIAAVLFGVYGWCVYAAGFSHDGVIGPSYNGIGSDYVVYYTAAKTVLAGDTQLLWHWEPFTARQNADFADWLPRAQSPHPWLYPPPFLLLLAPFARLAFLPSYAAFLLATWAAAVAGAWLGSARDRRARTLWAVALALAPAASVNAIEGQNAFFTLALFLGGVGLLGRADLAGGALLGLLAYKPQLALMVPIALLAARNWKALGGAAASFSVVALASAWAFGPQMWRDWIDVALFPDPRDAAVWFASGHAFGLSAHTCALVLGASAAAAGAVQAAVSLLAAACVWFAWRRPASRALQLGVLLAASLIAAPHLSQYDTLLLVPICVVTFQRLCAREAVPLQPVLALLLWAAPLLGLPAISAAGYEVPALILAALLLLVRTFAAPRAAGA